MNDRSYVKDAPPAQSLTTCDVVVVTFNSPPLPEAMWDLAEDPQFNLLVVDNASRTVPPIRSSAAKLIVSAENLGFGGGCNLALTHGEAPYILFVNPDCVLPLSAARDLIRIAEQREASTQRPVIVGARAVGDARQRVLPAGYSPSASHLVAQYLGIAAISRRVHGLSVYNANVAERPIDVDWVGGGCMVVSRSLFVALDGFDPRYFLYVEDVDLCLRAQGLGASVVLAGNVRAYHPVGTGSEATVSLRMAWLRNLRLLVASRSGRFALLRVDLALTLGAAIVTAMRPFGRKPTTGRPDLSMLVRYVFSRGAADRPSPLEHASKEERA